MHDEEVWEEEEDEDDDDTDDDTDDDDDSDRDVDSLVDDILDGDRDVAGVVVAAPAGAKVKLDIDKDHPDWIRVEVTHSSLERMTRYIGRDADGKLFVKNDYLIVKDEGTGLGGKIFGEQIKQAAEAGFDYITCWAAGSYGDTTWNGYYTWPRFGYDQDLASMPSQGQQSKACVERAKRDFPDAKSVLDIMEEDDVQLSEADAQEIRDKCAVLDKKLKRPVKPREKITGADWWLVHGVGLKKAVFQLKEPPPSRSREVLATYLAQKKKK